MLKALTKFLLCLTLMFSVLSAAIPLHNIFHQHHFIKVDKCSLNTCDKHLKSDTDHCHTHSDAVFLASIPKLNTAFEIFPFTQKLTIYFKNDNYFQFFYFTKNKAPPVLIIA